MSDDLFFKLNTSDFLLAKLRDMVRAASGMRVELARRGLPVAIDMKLGEVIPLGHTVAVGVPAPRALTEPSADPSADEFDRAFGEGACGP